MGIRKFIKHIIVGRRGDFSKAVHWGYWDLTRVWGIKFPLYYFWQIHRFDIVNGTDTRTAIPRDKYTKKPRDFDDGTFYFPSWTDEVLHSFKMIKCLLGNELTKYTFLDIGCGKGKVVLLWKTQLKRRRVSGNVIGIDYYDHVIKIAKENHRKIFGEEGDFFVEDATTCDYEKFGRNLIVYLYNPFGPSVLDKVLKKLSSQNVIVIYNNPVHEGVFASHDYKLIYRKDGWNPSLCTRIFSNTSDATSDVREI